MVKIKPKIEKVTISLTIDKDIDRFLEIQKKRLGHNKSQLVCKILRQVMNEG